MTKNNTANRPPDNALIDPSIKVGDFLYTFDLEGGITSFLVVATYDDGSSQVAFCNEMPVFYAGNGSALWAIQGLKKSVREAMVASAQWELHYHKKYVAYAEKILAAVDAESSLDEFLDGGDFD